MSKLGRLYADLVVQGGALQTHYGPDDAISGHVRLSYEPHLNAFRRKTQTSDLFGPLKIELKVRGTVNIRVRREGELPTRHDGDLFCQTVHVHEGSFKAQVDNDYTFPWSFTFPQDARPVTSATWLPTPTTTLPPSFGMHFSARPDHVDVRVQYLVETVVTVAGIDVRTIVPREDSWAAIKYDLSRPSTTGVKSQTSTFQVRVRMQGKHLAHPGEWQKGVKAKLTPSFEWETPDMIRLSFDVVWTNHQRIYAGQLLTYKIQLFRNELDSTATFLPQGMLDLMKVELVATTSVAVSGRVIGSGECVDQRAVQAFAATKSSPIAFREGDDHTVDVVLDYVKDAPTSFAHRKVSRSYLLRVELHLTIAGETIRVKRDCPVTMVPPPNDADNTPPRPSTSRVPPWSDVDNECPPPTYEETTSHLPAPRNWTDSKDHSKV